MLTTNKAITTNSSAIRDSLLKRRKFQDTSRDPLDALVDAKELHSLLLAINQRLSDPAMSDLLFNRLREDISSSDMQLAINNARELVIHNEKRFEETLSKAKELVSAR